MPLLLDNEVMADLPSMLLWDVMAEVDNLPSDGHCNDGVLLGDGSTTWPNSRDTTSPEVVGSWDRNGRNAAELSSADMDATLGRLVSGTFTSSDDGDALIGRGFGRTDCEQEASTVDGLKSSTQQQKHLITVQHKLAISSNKAV